MSASARSWSAARTTTNEHRFAGAPRRRSGSPPTACTTHALHINVGAIDICRDVSYITGVLTPNQLRAARALLGIDQRTLADRAGVSLPTIQRMEASDGYVRGVVDTLTKVVAAIEREGVELIGENSMSAGGGRGVRLRDAAKPTARASPLRLIETPTQSKPVDA